MLIAAVIGLAGSATMSPRKAKCVCAVASTVLL